MRKKIEMRRRGKNEEIRVRRISADLSTGCMNVGVRFFKETNPIFSILEPCPNIAVAYDFKK